MARAAVSSLPRHDVEPARPLLTLFRLQTAASTREMSASLCRRCLASSNICEVLSSSLQLRRAVSQESRLLTRNPAKTAERSALKHIHSGRSLARSHPPKIVLVPSLWSLKQHSRPAVKVHASHNGINGVAFELRAVMLFSSHI